ncbi:hypothetical protein FDA77_00925 [Clostridium botulinum]|nr:hypothetical protein [Clostridium botulinum]NFJ88512.1 hypothetical protein [Clostridium botulinum]HDI3121673.1 hypothetical protein [Clostridium botulinum]
MKKMKKGETILKELLKKYNTNIKTFKLLMEDDYPLIGKKIEEIIKKLDENYIAAIEVHKKTKKQSIKNESEMFSHLYLDQSKCTEDKMILLRNYMDSLIEVVMEGVDDFEC